MAVLPQPIRAALQRAMTPLVQWWGGLESLQRRHYSALALLMIGSVAHFLAYTVYYIEDAGISFAYAKNFVEGEGWVTYPGGERVEGFSNPLWTWLVAFFYALKVPPWTSAKVMGAVFGAATLPIAYAITRQCLEGRDAERSHIPLIPPMFLAASTTVAIWNGSGLENSLFNLLLAGGMYRVIVEGKENQAGDWSGFPWSAVCFLGLAMTRPEGLMYAAVGGFFRMVMAWRSRGDGVAPLLALGKWILLFWGPFLAYNAWRYSYFGWEFPNTYYAKVDGENRFQPWKWKGKGWKYITNYSRAYGLAYWLPLFAVGLAGLRDRRRWLVVLATVVGVVTLLWNGRDYLPPDFDPDWMAYLQRHWDMVRINYLLGTLAVLGMFTGRLGALRQRFGLALIGLGAILIGIFALREAPENARTGVVAAGAGLIFMAATWHRDSGAAARMQLATIGGAGVFFIVYAGGDWMKQWRFFSYVSVPMFVLLGVGAGELIRALPGSRKVAVGAVWATAILVGFMVPNLWNSIHAAPTPETTVSNVYKRVKYMTWVQNRLHLDRVTLFDVDMGAHMYYSGWRIVDVAGLVDVPMAHHLYQKAFIQDYVINERRPEFAHMHGGWASKVKIFSHPEFKREYLEIPGYPSGGRTLHLGNHIRRDIFVKRSYAGPPGLRQKLEGGVTFEGFDVVSPQVPVGGKLYLEYWLQAGFRKEGVRVLVALDDGQGNRHVAALPPGYDWYPVDDWKVSEHVIHRYDFSLPKELPEGTYDLVFVVLDNETGEVLGPRGEEPVEDFRFMRGELAFEQAVTIVTRDEATELAVAAYEDALNHASEGRCEVAWASWRQAIYHVYRNTKWRDDRRPSLDTELTACYVSRAQSAPTEEDGVRWLIEARWHDHHHPELLKVTRPLAEELDARGDAAFAEEDWEGAFIAYRDAVALDPRLSHTRRKAETARDLRLEIEGKVKDTPRNMGTYDKKEAEQRGRDGDKDDDDEDKVFPLGPGARLPIPLEKRGGE